MKISRRKFIGLAAAVALLPAELLASKGSSLRGKTLRAECAGKDPGKKISRRLFVDESGGASDRFRLAGCVVVNAASSKKLKLLLQQNLGDAPELKWHKVTSRNAEAYKAVADAILFALHRGQIDFRYSKLASSDANWRNSRTDIGYSSATELLMRHYAVESRDTQKLYIYPQRRRAAGSMLALRQDLNRFASNGRQVRSPVRLIEYRDSISSVPSQVVDFLVGALAYSSNVRVPNAIGASGKQRLAEYISARIPSSARVS